MEIELSSRFLRKARKLSKAEQKKLSDKIEIFRLNPNDSRLKTHALTGKLKGLYSFSLSYSKRVVFTYVVKNKILLLDLGSHGEVYR